jgi:hypothetical protein
MSCGYPQAQPCSCSPARRKPETVTDDEFVGLFQDHALARYELVVCGRCQGVIVPWTRVPA